LEDEERELVPDARELEPDFELDAERLRELEDERLRLDADRVDPLDFFLPPELPLLRLSAIYSPS
jgi:hypothetical protein